jgi:hypothetical protein
MNRRVGGTLLVQWYWQKRMPGQSLGPNSVGSMSLSSLESARYGTVQYSTYRLRPGMQALPSTVGPGGAERRPLEPPRHFDRALFHLPSSGTCSVHPSSILHPSSQTSPAFRSHFSDDSTTALARLATRQREPRLMPGTTAATGQQTGRCESRLGRPIRVGWRDGHLHFTRGGCCGVVCGSGSVVRCFCGSVSTSFRDTSPMAKRPTTP